MTFPAADDSRARSSLFLVERYLPAAAAMTLPVSVARAARLCALATGSTGTDEQVQYLHATYLPSEDTCLCLFRAPSAQAVSVLNTNADFAFDRITAAVDLLLAHPAHISPEGRRP